MTVLELIGGACCLIFIIACLDFVVNMQNKADDYLRQRKEKVNNE